MLTYVRSGYRPDLAANILLAAEKLEPSNTDVLADLAEILPFIGRPEEALRKIKKAIELNPKHPNWYLRSYAIALFLTGEYEQSAHTFESFLQTSRISKEYYVWYAAAFSLSGMPDKAKQVLDDLNFYKSGYPSTLSAIGRRWPLDVKEQEVFFRGLRHSGIPEG